MLTEQEYWKEVREIVSSLVSELRSENPTMEPDDLRDAANERLWETVDGHQWVIYTAYHYPILAISPNNGYTLQEFGSDGIVKNGQLDTAKLAFGALYADCMDELAEVEWEATDAA